LSCKSLRICGG